MTILLCSIHNGKLLTSASLEIVEEVELTPHATQTHTYKTLQQYHTGNQLRKSVFKSNRWHFSVFYLIEVLIWRGNFCWKPHLNQTSGSKVMSNWRILKTIENKRNSFLFLAISHNQCSRLPTDAARLQHIYPTWWTRCSFYTYKCTFFSTCSLSISLKSSEYPYFPRHKILPTIYCF